MSPIPEIPAQDDEPNSSILLVDDDADSLGVMECLFHSRGIRVLAAQSPVVALRLISAESEIRLVLSDYDMPGMDGVAFLRQVKSLLPEARRVLITGGNRVPDVMRALADGDIDRLVTKPWDTEFLKSLVARLLDEKPGKGGNRDSGAAAGIEGAWGKTG